MRKNDLRDLISSITPDEKKYCSERLMKGSKHDKELQQHFQQIGKLLNNHPDRVELYIKKIKAKDKKDLYDRILRIMRQHQLNRFEYWKIKLRILDFQFLFQRGLYDQAKQVLDELREGAASIKDHLLMLEVNYLTRQIERKNDKNVINALITESKELVKGLEEENVAHNAYDQLFQLVRHNDQIPEDQIKVEASPVEAFLTAPPPSSPQAERRYLQCKYIYANITGDEEAKWSYTIDAIKWWERNPFYQKNFKNVYIRELSNVIHAHISRVKDPSEYMRKLEKVPTSSQFEKQFKNELLDRSRIPYLIESDKSEELKSILPGLEKRIQHYSVKNRIVLMVNIAIFRFLKTDYRACQKWLEKICSITPRTSDREDIQVFARILFVITAYELNDPAQFDRNLKRVVRYLGKLGGEQQKYNFELQIIALLKSFRQARNESEERQLFRSLVEVLESHKKKPKGQSPLGWSQYMLWANQSLA